MIRILQISSIFPVKDSPLENAYVRTFIRYFQKRRDASFYVLKPETFLPKMFIPLFKKQEYWKRKHKVIEKSFYQEGNINVSILPFISIGSFSSLHAFFSMFVYMVNRKKISDLDVDKFDVIHAHYLFPDGYLAYKLSGKYNIPYVLTLRQEMRFFSSWFSKILTKKIINNSKAVTTQSYQMFELLKQQNLKSEVDLIPTGIEEYFFKDQVKSISKHKKLKLISVCNLVPIKNLESVLYALDKIEDKENISYSIYGTGPEEQRLKNLTKKLGLDLIVSFKGRVENIDLPKIFIEHEVFVQPSFKETFGLSYFEAMACGLPVIITENTGAYPLIKDKNVAFVVDPHDLSSISNCIQNLINNRELIVEKSSNCKEVSKIASWDNYVCFFEKQYLTLSEP